MVLVSLPHVSPVLGFSPFSNIPFNLFGEIDTVMGAVNSLCVSQQSERCVENHARLPKVKEFKRNLSSTFNVNEAQHNHDQLNVK